MLTCALVLIVKHWKLSKHPSIEWRDLYIPTWKDAQDIVLDNNRNYKTVFLLLYIDISICIKISQEYIQQSLKGQDYGDFFLSTFFIMFT